MLDSERTFKIKVRLIRLLFKGSWILTYFWHSSWHYFGYIFRKITQKYSFNGQYSWRRRIISSNWNLLKNYEKYFLFHLNKLNTSFANQILHILFIFTKPNVWYSWSLKILAIKRWFPFNFAKILQGRHFVKGGPKNFKLLADISFDSSLQNTVPLSLLLFLCARY